MFQVVSITSQGQITIPASIRKLLGLDKYPKATVRAEKDRIIVEPITDIFQMEGVLRKKAIKRKTIDQVIKLEEEIASKVISK